VRHKGAKALRRHRAVGLVRRAASGVVEVHRLVSLGLVVAAPAVSFAASKVKQTEWVLTVLALQLIIATGTWIIGEFRVKGVEKARQEASVETQVALGDALDPVARSLAKLTTMQARQRREQRSGLVERVLSAACGLGPDGSRTRACYFKLVDDEGPRRLVNDTSKGRSDEAKSQFVAGTPSGDAALKMIDQRGWIYCDDVDENPPPGWQPSAERAYKCFASVTVAAGPKVFGMLTLDAINPGDLTREDQQTLQVLGHLLGIAEQSCGPM
jgi:hypothetical protein